MGAKLDANLDVVELLSVLRAESRWATAGEQRVLARWSGWGALPAVFDADESRHAGARARLQELLGDEAWAAARRTTLNAHYTSPEVVDAIWRAVGDLGFTSGRVLEPGCGAGAFIGRAPPGASITGIELDPTTAEVAEHLHAARAEIVTGGFEGVDLPEAGFDLVIGNVPFGDIVVHDPIHNAGRHRLHNYFIVKSLRLVRPGGVVAVITSRYTLDSKSTAARREMAAVADLLGAVRMHAGAFAGIAGTDAVTDIVLLRRRLPTDEAAPTPWLDTVDIAGGGAAVPCNRLFVERPALVAGRVVVGRGMYRDHDLTVSPPDDPIGAVRDALATVVDEAHALGRPFAPGELDPTMPASSAGGGSFAVSGGGFVRLAAGAPVPYAPRVKKDATELRRLIGLRDAARSVLNAQRRGVSDPELVDLQGELRRHYDAYVAAHGPLNRFTAARTGRTDPDTGEEIQRRMRPRMGGFRDDPDWPLVAALEVFDEETQRARPAAIFSERVISPPTRRDRVGSVDEAVAVSLDECGEVSLARCAELLGVDRDDALVALASITFEEPETARLVPAAEYLSGDVRAKLDIASVAAARDRRFARNVDALEAALPPQLQPAEITARLGAPWIPADDVETFCVEVLGAQVLVEHLESTGRWAVALRAGRRASVSLTSEWGTGRADAVTLLEAALNQRQHTVTDESVDGRRVRNDAETIVARQKQEEIIDRFSTWVWEDPARSARLAERYNRLFCSVAIAEHDGAHLSLPGLAAGWTPHPHQRDAVARILTDGRALLAHAVGAGKTATMVMAAMEQRRLGLAAKPAIVVPNHMLDQFTREWLQLYPSAQLLVADRERLAADRRKEFVARCATGDWDGVLFTHSGFARLPLRPETLAGYMATELDRARLGLIETSNGKGLSIKRLEKRIAQLEQTYERLLAEERKDDGIFFEETGVDYLYLDEAHLYKNRRVDSSIEGMAHAGSQRAQDLDAKLWCLRTEHGTRVATFATATPVANSMAELWVMQTYLQPDVLAAAGIEPFDGWAATFGRTVTALELAPDGSSYRVQTRFARFQNVPELMSLYRQVADVRTADQLGLPTPALRGGAPETVVVPPSAVLSDFVADLARRAECVRNRTVTPEEDNMLKITGDGRRAALDVRLVGLTPPAERTKLAAAAERIAAIHAASAGNRYLDEIGDAHPRPGGLQLVFCDVSTPAGEGWNAYDALRDLLVARGLDRDTVRFVHEAPTDADKARLFQACRDGRVGVLIGSTEKMGVGTNVQARAVALHHLDSPWRPADIEQRDGRVVRQGNQNDSVEIVRYVTEGSFDTYMWQTLERKAAFIAQVSRGDAVERHVDDIGDQALSFAEVKALATGNPLILEKAAVDNEIARLRRLERAHQDDQHRLGRAANSARSRIERADLRLNALETALAARLDTAGDAFCLELPDRRVDKRAQAGAVLIAELRAALDDGLARRIGVLGGMPLRAEADRRVGLATLGISTIGEHIYSASELANADPVGLVRRVEHAISGIDDAIAKFRTDREEAAGELSRAEARLGAPFADIDALGRAVQRQRELNDLLTEPLSPGERSDSPKPAGKGFGLV